MSTGQTLLALGALTLLSLLTLSANRAITNSYSNMLETQAMTAAIAEAVNLLEEIGAKSFDQAIATDTTATQGGKGKGKGGGPPPWAQGTGKKPSDFTPPGLLGKETGEQYPKFNDIDDFNSLSIQKANPLLVDSLRLGVKVVYVNPANAEQQATVQTTAKKVQVSVFTTGMQDTLKLVRVFYQ
jgi:hypothetical protein